MAAVEEVGLDDGIKLWVFHFLRSGQCHVGGSKSICFQEVRTRHSRRQWTRQSEEAGLGTGMTLWVCPCSKKLDTGYEALACHISEHRYEALGLRMSEKVESGIGMRHFVCLGPGMRH